MKTTPLHLYLSFVSIGIYFLLSYMVAAEIVTELDAGKVRDPRLAIPPWSRRMSNIKNIGKYFLQNWTSDDPLTSYGTISSPMISGLMQKGGDPYGIEFRVQPLSDIPNAGNSHYANLILSWGDNQASYCISIDKDSDDSGEGKLGAITSGKNKMKPIVEKIDFSEPRTIFIGYRGDTDEFDFYVDGELKNTVEAVSLGHDYNSKVESIVTFGDSTTGQSIDVAAKWYFVRVHDQAVPTVCQPESSNSEPIRVLKGIGLYCATYSTERETVEFIAKCKEAGIGYLMPSISAGGAAVWKTEELDYFARGKEQLEAGYDRLEMFIKHAHLSDMEVYPSVAVCPGGRVTAEHPEWETRDRQGRPSKKTTTESLALSYPEARMAKVRALLDLVKGYDIDGILLDYCRYPENTKRPEYSYGYYGYDKPILEACMNIYGFDPRQEEINSANWNIFNRMRNASIVALVREIHDAVKEVDNDIVFLGFGGGEPEIEALSCGRNNIAWAEESLIDYHFMGIYPDPISLQREIVSRVKALMPPAVAVYSSLSPFNGFQKSGEEMIAAAKEQLAGGAAGLWIYRADALEQYDLWSAVKEIAELAKKR